MSTSHESHDLQDENDPDGYTRGEAVGRTNERLCLGALANTAWMIKVVSITASK